MTLEFGGFRLEPDGSLYEGELRVHLAPKPLALLRHLLRSPGRLLAAEDLRRALWPDVFVTSDSISRCVHALRRALGDTARRPRFVKTVPRQGLLFCATVQVRPTRVEHRVRLAVAPFRVDGPVPSTASGEYLALELTRLLTERRGLGIDTIAWSVTRARARAEGDALDAARALDADAVVSARVGTAGEGARFDVELVDREGVRIWGETAQAPWPTVVDLLSGTADRIASVLAEAGQTS